MGRFQEEKNSSLNINYLSQKQEFHRETSKSRLERCNVPDSNKDINEIKPSERVVLVIMRNIFIMRITIAKSSPGKKGRKRKKAAARHFSIQHHPPFSVVVVVVDVVVVAGRLNYLIN